MSIGYLTLFLALLATALGQFFYKKHKISVSNGVVHSFFYLAVFFLLLAPVLSFISLKYLTVDVVYISTSLTILFVAFFSAIFLKEVFSKRIFMGLFFLIFGVLIYAA